MEYIEIGIVIAVAIAAGIIIYTKFKKHEDIPSGELVSAPSTVTSGKDELVEIHHENELVIQMEMLPAEAIEDDTKLVEITDSKVLAHVNNLVPGLALAGNAVNNAAQAVQAAKSVVLSSERIQTTMLHPWFLTEYTKPAVKVESILHASAASILTGPL